MFDITHFTLGDMVACSGALRSMGMKMTSMENVAGQIIRYFHEHLIEKETGKKAFVLVRLFKTHPYGELDDDLQRFARNLIKNDFPAPPAMKCLTLLASAGEEPAWNTRQGSRGHKALPLPSEHFVEQFPMVRQLVQQLGLEINSVLKPDPDIVTDLAQTAYNVFHVPEAVGSAYVPAQQEFVVPYGVRSVIGFGGMLPSGNLFAVIMFSRIPIPRQTADMFKTMALSVKVALLPFDGAKIFG